MKGTSMRDPWHSETDEEAAAMMERLDPAEREILEAINDPHYVFPPSDAQRVAALKHKAQAEGIPYQTLIGSILHKYVTGQLIPPS